MGAERLQLKPSFKHYCVHEVVIEASATTDCATAASQIRCAQKSRYSRSGEPGHVLEEGRHDRGFEVLAYEVLFCQVRARVQLPSQCATKVGRVAVRSRYYPFRLTLTLSIQGRVLFLRGRAWVWVSDWRAITRGLQGAQKSLLRVLQSFLGTTRPPAPQYQRVALSLSRLTG